MGGLWDSGTGLGRRVEALFLACTAVAVLLLVFSARSALGAEQYEPAVKVAPGVFLAEGPQGEPSADREASTSGEVQTRIVGGDTTTIAEWPWQAAITLNPAIYSGNGFERFFCGGSLVTPTIIITAAHCVYDDTTGTFFPVEDHASITGRTTLSDSTQGQEIAWSDYFVFVDGSGTPLYDPATAEWDVVFAELASPSPASNSTPIQIAGADEAAFWAPGDENAWATGWGTTSSGGSASDTLREVNVDVIADSTCGSSSVYGSAFYPETMVCAGELSGGQDTCQGDSGGPLVTPIGVGIFRLIGDTSWGVGCALANSPGVYGRVAEDPMCGALQNGIQTVAGADVVGPGGCLEPPSISTADVSLIEGNSGQSNAQLVVSLSHASAQQITVSYATADGSATSSSDYDSRSGTLTFSPGETSKQVSVPVNGDLLDEPNETFTVNLSAPTSATMADSQGIGTIIDDDDPPSTGGETGDTGGGTGETRGADVAPPELVARAKKSQPAGKPIKVKTSSNEDAVVVATGKVIVKSMSKRRAFLTRRGRANQSFKLKTARAELQAGETQVLKLAPKGNKKKSKRALKKIARLVGRGGKAAGRITIRTTDAAGNSSTRKLKVNLKR